MGSLMVKHQCLDAKNVMIKYCKSYIKQLNCAAFCSQTSAPYYNVEKQRKQNKEILLQREHNWP